MDALVWSVNPKQLCEHGCGRPAAICNGQQLESCLICLRTGMAVFGDPNFQFVPMEIQAVGCGEKQRHVDKPSAGGMVR